ncbi:glutathione S-transferase alpha-4-like [Peromyscus leucopus]|uniref:glutathione S-transferase alpha-4-like n=1 Tax=Peromyscus leucopus TaxID=10041 RepID=UPI0018856F9D|nr:glutathione S-transferase alpha-4-like [Peromyscus leucopus]
MKLVQTRCILHYKASKDHLFSQGLGENPFEYLTWQILKDHGEAFLVGNQLSWADIQLLEAILMVEELSPPVLSDFPLLQAFKTRISNIPAIKKFLQPGSQRKPPPDDHYVKVVRDVLKF